MEHLQYGTPAVWNTCSGEHLQYGTPAVWKARTEKKWVETMMTDIGADFSFFFLGQWTKSLPPLPLLSPSPHFLFPPLPSL